jgi:hypothetical protein
MLHIVNYNSAEEWFEAKCRATILRRHRDELHPGLAAELVELERAGY